MRSSDDYATFKRMRSELETEIPGLPDSFAKLPATVQSVLTGYAEPGVHKAEMTKALTDLLTGLLVISLGPAYGLEFRHRQEQAIRPAALAVAAYKLDNDGYPESLSDLVHAYLGSDPVDLFDRKPIRYKFSTKFKSTGFVVYSVGPDLDDDGGRSWDSLDENSGDDQADIPIRVGDYPDPNPGG